MEMELKQLQTLKEKAYILACGSCCDMSNEKVQTSKNNSSEQKFAAYADYSKQVDDMISELMEYRGELLNALNQMNNHTYKTLLIERYINCQTWEKVAEKMRYSYIHVVHRLHPQALEAMEKLIKKGDIKYPLNDRLHNN